MVGLGGGYRGVRDRAMEVKACCRRGEGGVKVSKALGEEVGGGGDRCCGGR